MGLSERDYYSYSGPRQPGIRLRLPQTAVGWLILINVGIWVADAFTPARYFGMQIVGRWLSDHLAISSETLFRPWLWWQWISYGFAHSPVMFWHLLGNMIGLFFFGRDVEWRYGRAEFIRLYLTMLVVAGVAWSVWHAVRGDAAPLLYGASGAVTGIIILFALLYPHRTVLLFFVIPVPAWVLGVLLIVSNLLGSFDQTDSHVAFGVHLVGAAVAVAYYRFGWHLGRWLPSQWLNRVRRWWARRRLRVYQAPEEEDFPHLRDEDRQEVASFLSEDRLAEEVDRILAKISRHGESSLTAKERRTLEEASRQYQRRRRLLQEHDRPR